MLDTAPDAVLVEPHDATEEPSARTGSRTEVAAALQAFGCAVGASRPSPASSFGTSRADCEPLAGLSAICWAEFLCGPVRAAEVELVARIVGEPTPFTADDAATAARLFKRAGRRRGTFVDCMVAATALRMRARLATSNRADFRRFESAGLEVVAPTARR